MEITKEKSLLLKGIAINFMILLHLFAFPERISPCSITPLFNILGHGLEYYVGNFGGICVGIYLILSGYGFSKKYENKKPTFKEIIGKLLNFYKSYWKIFIIFIPLGYYLRVYTFDLKTFILNFFSYSNSYNGEWWFIKYYMLFIVTFYFIKKYNIKNILLYSIILFLFHFSSVIYKINGIEVFYRYCYWQIYFVIGMEISKLRYKNIKIVSIEARILLICLFFISSLITYLGRYEGLFQPIIVLIFIVLFLNVNLSFLEEKFLKIFGKYSMNIWLFHSFFCYYYFKEYVYYFKNSILIYFIFICFNLFISILIDKLYLKLKII